MNTHEQPALHGGPAVRPQGPPTWPFPDPAIAEAVQQALADGSWGQYHGPHVARLEQQLSTEHDVPAAFTCASGTFAVEAALRAAGVGPGTEVLLGAYDYEPSFLAIHALGAMPVLVDTDVDRPCLNPHLLEAARSPLTKAVLVTHLHGALANVAAVRAWATAAGVTMVEDAAQAVGARCQGIPAGATGDLGILSFGGSKLLSAGRGGAILLRDEALAPRVKLALHRGIQQLAPLAELQACVLHPQLTQLAERTLHRQRNVELLRSLLHDVPGLSMFNTEPTSAYFKLGFHYDEAIFGLPRATFVALLRAEGIAFDEGFRALHVGRAAKRFHAPGPLPNATRAGARTLVLHHPVLSLSAFEIEQVACAVRKIHTYSASRS